MKIDWLEKLRFYLQVMAFCLAISAIQFAFQPERPYVVPLVYSVLIGGFTWALIDFGRHFFPSSSDTGWPTGMGAVALPLGGIVTGYLIGTALSDAWFGWSSWDGHSQSQLRVSLLITALAGIVCTYYFYNRGKSAYLETRVSEVSRQATESKLRLLQAQIEPHMLFNTLANLRALIATDPARALTMLDHLNSYLRSTLGASRACAHSLQTEFDRLRDYLELMAIRMGTRLRYALELPPELAGLQVPPLLLQPLVENAIKHGLEPAVGGGSITVAASLAAGRLTLTVADTGVGLKSDSASTGFGLAQVRERLHTLHGHQNLLQIMPNTGGGTRVLISLPQASPP